jgi:hypothetical protein
MRSSLKTPMVDKHAALGSLACARDFACGLKRPQIGSTLCSFVSFVLIFFQDSSKKTIAGMNTGNRTQEITADQFIKIFPNQLSRFL